MVPFEGIRLRFSETWDSKQTDNNKNGMDQDLQAVGRSVGIKKKVAKKNPGRQIIVLYCTVVGAGYLGEPVGVKF